MYEISVVLDWKFIGACGKNVTKINKSAPQKLILTLSVYEGQEYEIRFPHTQTF